MAPAAEFPNRATHPVTFLYAHQEQTAIFRIVYEEDVDRGGYYDARSAAINLWSHHWQQPATWDESTLMGTFYFHWAPPELWQIETEEGFSLEDLMQALGRLELKALGRVKHWDVPHENEGDVS
jgi:hypothetical protein